MQVLITTEHNGSLPDRTVQLINRFLDDKLYYWPCAEVPRSLVQLIRSEFRAQVSAAGSAKCYKCQHLAGVSPLNFLAIFEGEAGLQAQLNLDDQIDDALQGWRLLNGLLGISKSHKLLGQLLGGHF